ncbi:ABC transporter permease subunit [Gynuella sp.]|uniref:ABC transporter permease subunit n=1 Tax=Gynuella sp. TaxID=2969146 RepID=UPI003D11593C
MLLNQSKTEQLAENLVEAEMSGRSLWKDAANRFIHNKAAMTSLVILGLIVAFTIIGPYVAVWDHENIDWDVLGDIKTLGAPSLESGHYFGTDESGRDLFSRVIQGTQISLMVGVIGSLIAVLIGTLYGATAGYVGGKVDGFMMRFVDIMMSIPYMFILILLLVVFGRSIILIFVGIGAISWLDMSRIVRGQTLSLKNKEYIEAAIATGVSSWRIILRHIVPNVLGIVIVYATLLVPNMILTESFISFLGLGVQEPDTSWGVLISQGAKTMTYGTVWQLAFPLAFFIVTLLCFFFIGDGLRDALDPKDR